MEVSSRSTIRVPGSSGSLGSSRDDAAWASPCVAHPSRLRNFGWVAAAFDSVAGTEDRAQSRPRPTAASAALRRFVTLSSMRMLATWVLTVRGLRKRASAISLSVRCRASRRSTSSSRAVRPAGRSVDALPPRPARASRARTSSAPGRSHAAGRRRDPVPGVPRAPSLRGRPADASRCMARRACPSQSRPCQRSEPWRDRVGQENAVRHVGRVPCATLHQGTASQEPALGEHSSASPSRSRGAKPRPPQRAPPRDRSEPEQVRLGPIGND